MKALLLVAIVAGCTDFQTIDRGVCGNGVVEPGEDCDSSDPSCVKCAYACKLDADCEMGGLPGYTCGPGGLCGAPAGKLAPAHAIATVSFSDVRISDINDDRIADLIGLSPTSLTTRFGDAIAPLTTSVSLNTSTQTGAAGWGDLDNDGRLDLMIPTRDGLVAYSSTYGELSPLAVNSGTIVDDTGKPNPNAQVLSLNHLREDAFAALVYDPTGQVPYVGLLVSAGAGAIGGDLPCGQTLKPEQILLDQLDLFTVSTTEFVLAIPLQTDQRRVCVLDIVFDKDKDPTAATVTALTPTPRPAPHKTVLANLNYNFLGTDPCPSLLSIEQQTGQTLSLTSVHGSQASIGPKTCTLDLTGAGTRTFSITGERSDAQLVGRFSLVPALFTFTGDAIVTSDGVFLLNVFSNTAAVIYASSRPLKAAYSGDVNGDGQTDAILVAAGTDDIDVLLRSHSNDSDGYQLTRIDTAAEVSHVAIDDFDGNGLADVAYAELTGDHQRLMVAYGTHDGLIPPIEMASFAGVSAMNGLGAITAEDTASRDSDLMVGIPSPDPTRPYALELTIMVGSASRTLVPVIDPRINDENKWTFRNVSVGRFGGEFVDAFGLGYNADPTSASGTLFQGWPVFGTEHGLDPAAVPLAQRVVAISGVAPPCEGIDVANPSEPVVCIDGQTVSVPSPVASPIAPNGHDLLYALDRYGRLGVVDPTMAGALSVFPLGLATPAKRVRDLFYTDLDGDGALDLVATFELPTTGTGAVFVCALDKATGLADAAHCHDVLPTVQAFDSAVVNCADAAVGAFAPYDPAVGARTDTDLVVACTTATATALYRITAGTASLLAPELPDEPALLRSGDIDGDGVPDLVYVHGPAGAQTLAVLRQCASRDLSCQKGENQ